MCFIFEDKNLSYIILQAVIQFVGSCDFVPLRCHYEAEYRCREGGTTASCSKIPGSDFSVETAYLNGIVRGFVAVPDKSGGILPHIRPHLFVLQPG
jgi:hypothetical protein